MGDYRGEDIFALLFVFVVGGGSPRGGPPLHEKKSLVPPFPTSRLSITLIPILQDDHSFTDKSPQPDLPDPSLQKYLPPPFSFDQRPYTESTRQKDKSAKEHLTICNPKDIRRFGEDANPGIL